MNTASTPVRGDSALEAALAREFGTLSDLLALHARERPAHPALVLGDETLDYAHLDAQVDAVAAALRHGGLQAGDTIAICAGMSLAYVLTFLGALRAGVVVAPLPPSATADQLLGLMDNAGARLLFTDAATGARWAPASTPPRVLLDGAPTVESADGPGWTAWLDPAARAGLAPAPAAVTPEHPFNLIYSSGTTGVPKGIVQSCAMRWAQLRQRGYTPDSVALLALPLYSNLALTNLFRVLAMGATTVLMAKFDAGGYLALAQAHGATHSVLVPIQFRRLLDHPDFDRTDLSRLVHRSTAGAPFSAALKAEVLRRWPGELIDYYSMTEGGGRTELLAHAHPDKLHTIGRPSAGSDIRVIDEDGRELPVGGVGEIVGHSATMMTGYHGLPDKTREAEWFDATGKRFIRTGDVGRRDEDGFFVLMDRRKELVISGGFNIYPSDLEAVLIQHPDVLAAAVVGVGSARWGETPVGFVEAAPGAALDEAALREWANARLGSSQRLADVVVCESLPRSEIGKVQKRALREGFSRSVP